MDHDRKVSGNQDSDESLPVLVQKTKEFFLQVARDYRKSKAKYDLATEFGKTRYNKNLKVFMTMAATTIILLAGAYTFSSTWERTNNQVRISGREFEDIDLRDLLRSFRTLDDERNILEASIASRQTDLELAQSRARNLWQEQAALARTRYSDPEQLATRLRVLDQELRRTLANLAAEAEQDNAPMRDRLAVIEDELASFDPRSLESAKSQELVLQSERSLFEIELSRLRGSYEERINQLLADVQSELERKEGFINDFANQASLSLAAEAQRLTELYNPLVQDTDDTLLLAANTDPDRTQTWQHRIHPEILELNILQAQDIAELNQSLKELQLMYGILDAVPWTNDMPKILTQLRYRTLQAVDIATDKYLRFLAALEGRVAPDGQVLESRAATIQGLEAIITELREQALVKETETAKLNQSISAGQENLNRATAAFAQTTRRANQEALVVDTGTPASIAIWIRPEVSWPVGQRVYLVRNGGMVLGEWELVRLEAPFGILAQRPNDPATQALVNQVDPLQRTPIANDWAVRKEAYNPANFAAPATPSP